MLESNFTHLISYSTPNKVAFVEYSGQIVPLAKFVTVKKTMKRLFTGHCTPIYILYRVKNKRKEEQAQLAKFY